MMILLAASISEKPKSKSSKKKTVILRIESTKFERMKNLIVFLIHKHEEQHPESPGNHFTNTRG
jgi:hypothetical protein